MSDIGLFPPGFGVWICSLGWIILCAAGLLICLLVAWLRTRRSAKRFRQDVFFGWAIGALVAASAAGISMALISWSGSLGAFARWIEHGTITPIWLTAQVALWPAVALVWNRVRREK